jgi:hypothetical protein
MPFVVQNGVHFVGVFRNRIDQLVDHPAAGQQLRPGGREHAADHLGPDGVARALRHPNDEDPVAADDDVAHPTRTAVPGLPVQHRDVPAGQALHRAERFRQVSRAGGGCTTGAAGKLDARCEGHGETSFGSGSSRSAARDVVSVQWDSHGRTAEAAVLRLATPDAGAPPPDLGEGGPVGGPAYRCRHHPMTGVNR